MVGIPIPPPQEPLTSNDRANDNWYRYWDGQSRSINDLSTSLAALTSNVSAITTVSTSGTINSGTVGTTGGDTITFTGIPANVKRVTVLMEQVALSSVGGFLVQLGTSVGAVSAGYLSAGTRVDSTGGSATFSSTIGFRMVGAGSTGAGINICMEINRVTSHTWVSGHTGGTYISSTGAHTHYGGGSVALGGQLERVIITNTATANNVFVAGQANIFWEF